MKKIRYGFTMMLVLLICLAIPVSAKTISKSQCNKICKVYMKQHKKLMYTEGSLLDKAETWEVYFYDINKDGIMEMIIPAEGSALGMTGRQCLVYTYKSGKVVKCHSEFSGLQDSVKKKAITYTGKSLVIHGRTGGNQYDYTVYKMNKKGKLVKTVGYKYIYSNKTGKATYYKNNKKISKTTFNKWEKKLKKVTNNKTWSKYFWGYYWSY